MKLLDRIKEWLGIRKLLRELPAERRPVAVNLALARKVAIVLCRPASKLARTLAASTGSAVSNSFHVTTVGSSLRRRVSAVCPM